jgi:hypothetical protein
MGVDEATTAASVITARTEGGGGGDGENKQWSKLLCNKECSGGVEDVLVVVTATRVGACASATTMGEEACVEVG